MALRHPFTIRPILASLVLSLALPLAAARADDWFVGSASGAALILENNRWTDVADHQALPDTFILRTLHGARLTVASPGAALAMGENGLLVVTDGGASTIDVELVAGSVTVATRAKTRIRLVAGSTGVDVVGGLTAIRLVGGRVWVEAAGGTVSAFDRKSGTNRLIVPGSTASARAPARGLQDGPVGPPDTSGAGKPGNQGNGGNGNGGQAGGKGKGKG